MNARARRLLDRLTANRIERHRVRDRLGELDVERRALLRDLAAAGVPQAELARIEGVTPWAIGSAIKRAGPSASRGRASTKL